MSDAKEKRLDTLTKFLAESADVPTKLVEIKKENRDVAIAENQEIEKKLSEFLKGINKTLFSSLMGASWEDSVFHHQKIIVGILKRKGYPLCEIMTTDGKNRIGFVGFIPDEINPFRKIDWSKDSLMMSVIFKNPNAKKGEDNRLMIPKHLGLRYSNLNSLNKVIKEYINDHYKPFNKFVNEFQSRRFVAAQDEFVDENGIRWVKNAGAEEVTAVDEKGIHTTAGTVLGIGKIIHTKNRASFTWWNWNVPSAPRNVMIKECSEQIIRIASKPAKTLV